MGATRTTREWLTASAPPAPRRRSLWVRVLVALTSATALLGTVAIVAAAALLPPIGARRAARSAAMAELQAALGPGEQIVARTFASQRRWTDMWRESFGVVVATDRRLLSVSAPPTPLLRPRDDGPQELLVESYPYDAAFVLEPRAARGREGRGLTLRTPATAVDFLVDDASWAAAEEVMRASAAARGLVTRQREAVDAAPRSAPRLVEEYVTHIVRRGETLTGLGRRYRTSPEVLRQLNRLTTDEIQVGQRLRVPRVAVADSTA
jgi:LysM repeat protein